MNATLKNRFIKATECFNTFEAPVPAYYFRRTFVWEGNGTARLTIAACGFYELYFNGKRITRGFLSPYISNPNDYVYYDVYDLAPDAGENVIALVLGNGFQNNPGGHVWNFDQADFRSAPMFALQLESDEGIFLESNPDFKIAPSPVRSDDYRFGEHYDANYEIDGWNQKGFDDSSWSPALRAAAPKGELQQSDVAPIIKECELAPVAITPCGNGYLYDFGISHAGVCRLQINGTKGQVIRLRHADALADGDLDLAQIWFPAKPQWDRDKTLVHMDSYTCKGGETEVYEPSFTYHGFRYVKVEGITAQQATPSLLTFLVYHTQLDTRGDFSCSDPVTETLQKITRRSITANFHHFPTDCPQREKNGWTADAALTCEAALLNFNPERNYRQWLRNIRKAQRPDGSLPGIIPTTGWGFHWGNGPAWDCVLAQLPYYTYLYRGQTEMITESAQAFLSYLRYLRTRVDEQGLLHIGLGDWCHVTISKPKAPLALTDTVTAMDTAGKMAVMFDAVGMHEEAAFARKEAAQYKTAARAHLIDPATMTAAGECQTSQAMCLHYGVFEKSEEPAAFDRLLDMIHAQDDHIDVGVLGGRVLFHVLTRFGHSDLAFKMITREDYPSYGNWLARGATTLWENFLPDSVFSMNHHFWGDISAWFIKCLAGIQLNPDCHDVNTLRIAPAFVRSLDCASGYHLAPAGRICVSWQREGSDILLTLEIPENMQAVCALPDGFRFESGETFQTVLSGCYRILPVS